MNITEEKRYIYEGVITNMFPNAKFRVRLLQVRLDNGNRVLAALSGKI